MKSWVLQKFHLFFLSVDEAGEVKHGKHLHQSDVSS
jgi:hypothetical protein